MVKKKQHHEEEELLGHDTDALMLCLVPVLMKSMGDAPTELCYMTLDKKSVYTKLEATLRK